MQVNLKGFLKDKRKFSTRASSVNWWHKENVRWNLEGRTKGIHYDKRRVLRVIRTHEDPEQAETEQPTLFDLLKVRNKADKDLTIKMDREYESSVIRDEIEYLFDEKRKVGMRIAQLFQEEHLLSCDDDWCIECTKPIVDWYYDIFCN